MKSFIALFAILLFSLISNAQEESETFLIEKDTWSLGGFLSIGGSNREDTDMTPYNDLDSFSFSIRPETGYFVSDNLALGLSLGYSYGRTKYNGSELRDKSIRHNIMVSPYARKFFAISPKIAFTLMGSLEYSYDRFENIGDSDLDYTETNIYGVNLRPGFSYLLSDKFTIDANIGNIYYSYLDRLNDGREDMSSSNYGLNLSSNIYLGIRYYIN
ncbi:outer membrane beta-barrel protein [Christiangramia sp. SM2212]|uniref:Outer membrane beta-barrel protein n=1 Tax=Christiangramia sediminicola TaxID=3073267 RepID=A0ABU1EQS0_9FLAO|nr:outer membrane beta-barrel protein [Christiangramia sp. SM2212]MDR5590735.1 outer membrane beta-barrel protein [Christiangramia sp. SM2212]